MSIDAETELDRLKRKIDAGAQIVYTQPVFDKAFADKAAEACAELNVPVLVGVLPLRSMRHTEFMHNEVPGIHIPDWLRRRMSEAEDDASALEVGIEEAQALACEIRRVAQGLYLMPPFGSHSIAERVMSAII
jgi:methionine synthase / methylenetetrahydrofolate reductase(NADPH)